MISACRSEKPDVSVIVPVYNTKPYLKECLNSLIRQTLKSIEIIVVDDGSTDGSADLIDTYARKHKNIIPVHKKNGGVGSAYATGLKLAHGKYVGFIDSDDWADKEMYFILFKIAREKKCDVVKSGSYYTSTKKKKKFIKPQNCNRIIKNRLEVPEFVLGHPCHWTAIYKNSFLKKNKITITENIKESAADIEFIYQVWFQMKSLYVVDKAFVHYRLDRPESDRNSGSKMSFYLLNVHNLVRQYFLKQKAEAVYWDLKTYNEFHHLKYELQQRCHNRRKEFIYGLSHLFWNNLNENRIISLHFKWKDLFFYHVIACFPFLYTFNDKIRFWITRPGKNNQVIAWRFCGLWQWRWNNRTAKLKNKKKKFYLVGIRLF